MKYLKVMFSILVIFIYTNSSCDKTTNPIVDDAIISENIDVAGGIIEHPDGIQIEFEEGTFDSQIKVSLTALTEQEVTNLIPSEIEKISTAFSIDIGDIKPTKPVKIIFPLSVDDQNREVGSIGIFRYDGENTTFAGTTIIDTVMYTYTNDFSIFYIGTFYGDNYLFKQFRFHNQGLYHAIVCVNNVSLLHPEITAPISADYATICFTLPFENPVSGNIGWYPQGLYQFCTEWEDPVYGKRFRIIGRDPPNWTYSIGPHTLPDAPIHVNVNTSIAGSSAGECNCGGSNSNTNSELKAYYPFDGNANDKSGNGYNGTVYGATLTTDRFGSANSAYYFSGSDYIVFPDVPQFPHITWIAWFKSEFDLSGRKIITVAGAGAIAVGQDDQANHLYTYIETGYDDWNQSYSPSTCNDNVWHMGAITYDGAEVRAYIDGQEYHRTNDSGSIHYDQNGLWAGKHWLGTFGYFKGSIDDIRIYSGALSGEEILAIYNE